MLRKGRARLQPVSEQVLQASISGMGGGYLRAAEPVCERVCCDNAGNPCPSSGRLTGSSTAFCLRLASLFVLPHVKLTSNGNLPQIAATQHPAKLYGHNAVVSIHISHFVHSNMRVHGAKVAFTVDLPGTISIGSLTSLQ